jgi:Papain family cysteine protease
MTRRQNRWLSWQAKAVGALALASTLTQLGCHRKPSGGTPAPTVDPPAPSPSTSSATVAGAVNKATEPYWSPDHVLVLPPSTDPVDHAALKEIVAKDGEKCGLREVAPGVYARLECSPFERIPGREAFSPAKLDMLKEGRLHMSRNSPMPRGDRTEILPDFVDHRVDGIEGPVKNQGAVGACTAFSLSTVMDNAILRLQAQQDAGPPGVKDPQNPKEAADWAMSPIHIWSHYATPNMKIAAESVLHKTIAPLSVWPYSPRQACELEKGGGRGGGSECGQAYHVRPGSGAHDQAIRQQEEKAEREGLYKIMAVDHITSKPVNTDAIAAILATGADVWIGIKVDGHAWQHLKEQNPVIPDWHSDEGGHAVALAGYRKGPRGERQFLVHNSWGGTWGDHGFGWVNEEMVKRHLEYAYAVRIEDKNGKSPPQTDDACPENELIDADTGVCAEMCPGHTRRVNGNCEGGSPPHSNRRR